MRSGIALSVAFVTAAVTVAPATAFPTPFRDAEKPLANGGVPGNGSAVETSWLPSFGIGPVLSPELCGACEQDLQSRAATAVNNTILQGHLTQDEANKIIQLLQSNQGVQFLQGLEADIAPLLKASGHTNGTENHHLARGSSKMAVASTVFSGIGSLYKLASVIDSNLHRNDKDKREVHYAPAWGQDLETRVVTAADDVQQDHLTQDEVNQIMQLLQSSEGVQFLQALETDIAPLLKTSDHTNDMENNHVARSSKTAVASALFGGIGSLSSLAGLIASNLHQNNASKREVHSIPAWGRELETRAATAASDVQQNHLTQDGVNQIMQLLQSNEGVQFLQALETDIAPLLKTSGHTNGTENHHVARSSKTAVAGAVFSGIGSLSGLAGLIASYLHNNNGNKREVHSAPFWSEAPYYDFTATNHVSREIKRVEDSDVLFRQEDLD